jgi:phosphatidylglycerophosphate synthase
MKSIFTSLVHRLIPRRILTVVHPTVVSVVGGVVGVGCAVLIGYRYWLVALILWLANRLLDGFDGLMARETGRATVLGEYVDGAVDIAVFSAIFSAFIVSGRVPMVLAVIVLAGTAVNYCGCYSSQPLLKSAPKLPRAWWEMKRPLMGGTEMIVFVSLTLAVPSIATVTFVLLTIFTYFTIVERLLVVVRRLKACG